MASVHPIYRLSLREGITREQVDAPFGRISKQVNQVWKDGYFLPRYQYKKGNLGNPSVSYFAVSPFYFASKPAYIALGTDKTFTPFTITVGSSSSTTKGSLTIADGSGDASNNVVSELSTKVPAAYTTSCFVTGGIYYTKDTTLLNYYFPYNPVGKRKVGPFVITSTSGGGTASRLPELRDTISGQPAFTGFVGVRPCRGFIVGWGWKDGNHICWSSLGEKGLVPTWGKATLSGTTALFTDSESLSGENWLEQSPGDIMDVLPIRDAYLIYKNDSIVVMRPADPRYVWEFHELTGAHAINNPGAACQIPGGHAFVSISGDFVITDGSSFNPITLKDGGSVLPTTHAHERQAKVYYLSDSHRVLIMTRPPQESSHPDVDADARNFIFDLDAKELSEIKQSADLGIGLRYDSAFPSEIPSPEPSVVAGLPKTTNHWLIVKGGESLEDVGKYSLAADLSGSGAGFSNGVFLRIVGVKASRRVSGTSEFTGMTSDIKHLYSVRLYFKSTDTPYKTAVEPYLRLTSEDDQTLLFTLKDWPFDTAIDDANKVELSNTDVAYNGSEVQIVMATASGTPFSYGSLTIETNLPFIETIELEQTASGVSIPGTSVGGDGS